VTLGQTQKELVSVVTPVFNGQQYLGECIESVLAQSYENFEYIIVDNCSTDESLNTARAYAQTDQRIKVIEAGEHMGPIQNWNRSLRYISADAAYIKFVHADDWIYPDCIEKMVNLASSDESIGIVSAYRLEEDKISLDELPRKYSAHPQQRLLSMDGRDVVRAIFLEYASVLGSPSNLLYRRKAFGEESAFFNERYLHADKEAGIRVLESWNLGFIREVLTFTRRHNESVTSRTNVLDTRRQDDLLILKEHGATFLAEHELEAVRDRAVQLYYGFLARAVGRGRGREFWSSQRDAFRRAGIRYDRWRLLLALLRHWLDLRSALRNMSGRIESEEHLTDSSEAGRFVDTIRKPSSRSEAN